MSPLHVSFIETWAMTISSVILFLEKRDERELWISSSMAHGEKQEDSRVLWIKSS